MIQIFTQGLCMNLLEHVCICFGYQHIFVICLFDSRRQGKVGGNSNAYRLAIRTAIMSGFRKQNQVVETNIEVVEPFRKRHLGDVTKEDEPFKCLVLDLGFQGFSQHTRIVLESLSRAIDFKSMHEWQTIKCVTNVERGAIVLLDVESSWA